MTMEHFEEFWTVWPRKVSRLAASKAWEKGNCDPLSGKIIAAVKLQTKNLWAGNDAKFIPHPASWLNAARWDDEVQATVHKQAPSRPMADQSAPVYPQNCHWQATANGIMMLVLQKVGGVRDEWLPHVLEGKVTIGRRLRTLYGENAAPSEEWRVHSQQGYEWLLQRAKNGPPVEA